jgi:hypothetical protein
MNSNEELVQTSDSSRRKFVWGLGVLSVFAAVAAAIRFPFSSKKDIIACKPESNRKTIKMLTEDGRLVEIDESLLTANRKKVSNDELQNWIKK